jgi:hypothetical protein
LAASTPAAGSTQGTADTPRFTPPAGTYTTAQKVTISTTTVGASIRYTTNGTAPSETAGALYDKPFSVSSTTTIKAIAYRTGMTDSSVATGLYTINFPQVATPVFNPPQGTYTSVQTVSLSSITGGATIRYTADGSAPSGTAGTVYDKPITVSSSTTVKAIAYKSGMTDSLVNTAVYAINLAPPFSLTLSPRSANLLQGGSAPIQVSANRAKDFKDPITLSLGTLSAGVSGQLSRTSLSTSSPATLTLTLEDQLLGAIEKRILNPSALDSLIERCAAELKKRLADMEGQGSIITVDRLTKDLEDKKRAKPNSSRPSKLREM